MKQQAHQNMITTVQKNNNNNNIRGIPPQWNPKPLSYSELCRAHKSRNGIQVDEYGFVQSIYICIPNERNVSITIHDM